MTKTADLTQKESPPHTTEKRERERAALGRRVMEFTYCVPGFLEGKSLFETHCSLRPQQADRCVCVCVSERIPEHSPPKLR